jgi:hypothetical protein
MSQRSRSTKRKSAVTTDDQLETSAASSPFKVRAWAANATTSSPVAVVGVTPSPVAAVVVGAKRQQALQVDLLRTLAADLQRELELENSLAASAAAAVAAAAAGPGPSSHVVDGDGGAAAAVGAAGWGAVGFGAEGAKTSEIFLPTTATVLPLSAPPPPPPNDDFRFGLEVSNCWHTLERLQAKLAQRRRSHDGGGAGEHDHGGACEDVLGGVGMCGVHVAVDRARIRWVRGVRGGVNVEAGCLTVGTS